MKHNLYTIFQLIFEDPKGYRSLTIKEKNKWGFIVNRHLSRTFPDFAQTLNIRGGDFSLILDIWFLYLHNNRENREKNNSWRYWIWNKKKK